MKNMEELPLIKISVRNLVEFIFRSGDIDNRTSASQRADAMQEGSRMHRKIQRRMGASYQAEVPMKIQIETGKYILTVEGRADGVIQKETAVIDEIKGVFFHLERLQEPVFVHKAQAMCYAYIYAKQQNLDRIGVQITYCNLDTEEIRRFSEEFLFSQLEEWFEDLIRQYKKWANFQFEWKKTMTESVRGLEFPYRYRDGQKELAKDVYRTVFRRKNLFIQAPTGTGKTLSVLYPAIKAAGEGLCDKIFYLTAKTITQTVAKETCAVFLDRGYRAKVIQITAKEKMCFCEETDCNPIYCPYARGHYDRVNEAVYDLLQKEDFFTRETLLAQAEKFQVCPFEMCLDTAVWCDDIICDYNYAFDPNVHLKRFFSEGQKGDYVFLVDEAHNLVERGRKMYSAKLCKEDFLDMRKKIGEKDERLFREFSRCNKILLEYKRECDTYKVCHDDMASLAFALMRLFERLDFFLQKDADISEKKELTEFYLNLKNFLNVYEKLDERYVVYTEHGEEGRFWLHLFCVDPSYRIQECLDKGRACIFFSATLLPVSYYKKMLSAKTDNYAVYAKTSFSKDQKTLLIGRDVSSRYTRRNEAEFQKIASYIEKITSAKKGNYMVFFPSYKLMEQVYEKFLCKAPSDMKVIQQKSGMKEEEREDFLKEFDKEPQSAMTAFCVLGGIFGEGIDLKEERLIGVIVVGTGLPQTGNEREVLKNYYESKAGEGFDYAYRFPGMNKVLQAAGRVIRTTGDRGIIALLDERFLENDYLCLFPREWDGYQVTNLDNVREAALRFWEQF